MQVANDKVVSINYILTDIDGKVLDSSKGNPLVYLHGRNNIIPGLENALEGKATGDKLNVSVPPEEAYGEFREDMIQDIPKSAFGEITDIQPGMQFQMNSPNGPLVITVQVVNEETVTVDANHPLAGETLNFDVEVMDVREATEEELDHGHVHGPNGHHH